MRPPIPDHVRERVHNLSEGTRQAAIIKLLRKCGYRVERIQCGRVRVGQYWIHLAEPGTPDLLVVSPYLWLETKTEVGKLNAAQRAWHAWAERFGVPVAIVREPRDAVEAVRGQL